MSIHPKTSGAGVGAALGVLVVAVLQSINGVHMSPELPGAITGFLALLGAWLVPSGDPAPVVDPTPVVVAPVVTQPQPSAAPVPPAVPPAA